MDNDDQHFVSNISFSMRSILYLMTLNISSEKLHYSYRNLNREFHILEWFVFNIVIDFSKLCRIINYDKLKFGMLTYRSLSIFDSSKF